MYWSFWKSTARESSDLYQMLSWRVTPVRWASMSRRVTRALRFSSKKRMEGTDSFTGWSQVSLPSSTSIPAATAVKSLELEAIWNRVFGVKGSFLPKSR